MKRSTVLMLLLALVVSGTSPVPAATDDKTVVVPFSNETGERSLYWLGEAFATGLTDHLIARGQRTVEAERRREAAQDLGIAQGTSVALASALLVARQVGAPVVVTGEIHLLGPHSVEVRARLVRQRSRTISDVVRVRGDLNDLYRLQEDLARGLFPDGTQMFGSPRQMLQDVPLSAYELHVKALTESRPDPRRSLLDRSLEVDPMFAGALMERARVDLQDGQPQAALLWLDRIDEETIAFPERYWLLRADVAASTGDLGSARDLYQRSLTHRPLPAAHFGLASVLARQGRLVDARRSIEAGLQLDPENPTGVELREALLHAHQEAS